MNNGYDFKCLFLTLYSWLFNNDILRLPYCLYGLKKVQGIRNLEVLSLIIRYMNVYISINNFIVFLMARKKCF